MMEANDLSILDNNLCVLREHHPELAELLLEAPSPALGSLTVEAGKRGHLTLKATDANGTFTLNSPYDPVSEAARLIEQETAGKEFNVVVHLGLGLGYTLEVLLSKIDELSKVVVVEPDLECLRLMLQVRDMREVLANPNIIWSVGEDLATSVLTIMGELSLLKLKGWIPLIAAPTHRLHRAFVDDLIYKLSSEVTGQRLAKATELIASELFLKNSFDNLPQALGAPGVVHLYQAWDGKPAVIVSAGPSLEKHLPLLREHQDKILLIAVGAAWKSLRAADIEPHMVVTVDPFADNYPHFEGLEAKREWLVTDFACNTDVVRTFHGKKIFCHSTPQKEALFRSIYGEWGILLTGGSVANSAMSLALTMGAYPIILVGQDLAYTGGISHATGHTGKHSLVDAIEKNPADFREVPGYGGSGPVLTNSQMDAYRLWFERNIEKIEAGRVINATEGGAHILGAIEMPFAQALSLYSTEHISTEALWPDQYVNQKISIPRIKENLQKISKKVAKVKTLSSEAGEVMRKLVAAASRGDNCNALELQYNKLVAKIATQGGTADFFLTAFVQNEIFLTQRRTNLLGEEKSDRYHTNLLLHTSLPKACAGAIDFLNSVIAKLPQ